MSQSNRECHIKMLWKLYFDKEEIIATKNGKFNAYIKGIHGPVLLCLHGAGYNALTWALMANEIQVKINCRIIAVDLRGHGKTTTDNEEDISLNNLTDDFVDIVKEIERNYQENIVVIGHSLGGCVAVNLACCLPQIKCLIVLEAMEKQALVALPYMKNILNQRPKGFRNLEQAMQWYINKGITNNIEAAKLSLPGQLINLETSQLGSDSMEFSAKYNLKPKPSISHNMDLIEEELYPKEQQCPNTQKNKYTWKVNLLNSEPHWEGWFRGLSKKFVSVQCPKILLLASINQMDTELTIGQMQGKFQVRVIPKSGHVLQEDQPREVASVIGDFLVRLQIAHKVG